MCIVRVDCLKRAGKKPVGTCLEVTAKATRCLSRSPQLREGPYPAYKQTGANCGTPCKYRLLSMQDVPYAFEYT